MITVAKGTALMLYLSLFLCLCFGAWLISHLKGRNKVLLPPLYQLTRCEYCHFSYLSPTGKKLSQCPQCASFNQAD